MTDILRSDNSGHGPSVALYGHPWQTPSHPIEECLTSLELGFEVQAHQPQKIKTRRTKVRILGELNWCSILMIVYLRQAVSHGWFDRPMDGPPRLPQVNNHQNGGPIKKLKTGELSFGFCANGKPHSKRSGPIGENQRIPKPQSERMVRLLASGNGSHALPMS